MQNHFLWNTNWWFFECLIISKVSQNCIRYRKVFQSIIHHTYGFVYLHRNRSKVLQTRSSRYFDWKLSKVTSCSTETVNTDHLLVKPKCVWVQYFSKKCKQSAENENKFLTTIIYNLDSRITVVILLKVCIFLLREVLGFSLKGNEIWFGHFVG